MLIAGISVGIGVVMVTHHFPFKMSDTINMRVLFQILGMVFSLMLCLAIREGEW